MSGTLLACVNVLLPQPDELQKTLAFVSISTDGDVVMWTLTKCELLPERIMRLQPQAAAAATADEIALAQQADRTATTSAVGTTDKAAAATGEANGVTEGLLQPKRSVGGLCMDFSKVSHI
jgi:hypothetical protein